MMNYKDENVVAKFSTLNYSILESFMTSYECDMDSNCIVIEPHPEGAILVATDGKSKALVILDKSGFAKNRLYVQLDSSLAEACDAVYWGDVDPKDHFVAIVEDKQYNQFDAVLNVSGTVIKHDDMADMAHELKEQAFKWRNLVNRAITPCEQSNNNWIDVYDLEDFRKVAKRLTGKPVISFVPKAKSPFIIKFYKCDYAFGVASPVTKLDSKDTTNDLVDINQIGGKAHPILKALESLDIVNH